MLTEVDAALRDAGVRSGGSALSPHRGVVEILTILDRDGQRAHLRTSAVASAAHEAHPGDDPTEG